MADVRIRFGQNLRRLRLARSWSQEELAHQAGLSTAYLSRLEGGKFNPSLSMIVDLSVALEINPSELLADILGDGEKGRVVSRRRRPRDFP